MDRKGESAGMKEPIIKKGKWDGQGFWPDGEHGDCWVIDVVVTYRKELGRQKDRLTWRFDHYRPDQKALVVLAMKRRAIAEGIVFVLVLKAWPPLTKEEKQFLEQVNQDARI